MSDSDGSSETPYAELTTVIGAVSESGEEASTTIRHSLSGELKCRAFTMISCDPPKIWLVTDAGSFYVKITDCQVALMVEEGSKFIADKIRAQAK